MSFEGSEKKIEIVLRPGCTSLREKGQVFWDSLVKACNATILSSLSNDRLTAYLLSESSLFVWDDRLLMITCGQTTLIDSVFEFIKNNDKELIDSLIFQRKNEYYSHMQETDFMEDVKRLREAFPGKAFRFGDLDGHHTFLFHLNKPFGPDLSDQTSELLMYHIDSKVAETFQYGKQSKEEVRKFLQLHELLPGFQFDDFIFRPYGYSLNAIKDHYYATIHVTPEEGSSYVSFETNFNLVTTELLENILEVFKPGCFDVINFNLNIQQHFKGSFQRVSHFKQSLDCGYKVDYSYYSKKCETARAAVEL